jgi:hypothetical protein
MVFIPNKDFIKELEVEPEQVKALENAAEAVAEEANKLRKNIMREEGAVLVRNDSNRFQADVYIVNVDPGGHLDEWGSVNNPAYAPLRRAVSAVGLDFQEDPKR